MQHTTTSVTANTPKHVSILPAHSYEQFSFGGTRRDFFSLLQPSLIELDSPVPAGYLSEMLEHVIYTDCKIAKTKAKTHTHAQHLSIRCERYKQCDSVI